MQTKNLNDTEFIVKITDIMRENPEIVDWSDNGSELLLKDIDLFCQKVLPQYFRHSNFNSFIRQVHNSSNCQLNIYSFYKTTKTGRSMSFKNQIFRRGNEKNFFLIQRKRKLTDLQNFQQRFEKQRQHLISKVNEKSQITLQTKQTIIYLLEYKYLSHVNLRRMKSELNSLMKELKDSRNQKTKKICAEIKKDLLGEINELNLESKRIDQFIEQNFLRTSEKARQTVEPVLHEKLINQQYQLPIDFTHQQQNYKQKSFTKDQYVSQQKNATYQIKQNLKSFNSIQIFFDQIKSKNQHFMFEPKLYLPFSSLNSFMMIPNYIPAPSQFGFEGKINFYCQNNNSSKEYCVQGNLENNPTLEDYEESASMSFVKDFQEEENCNLPVAN